MKSKKVVVIASILGGIGLLVLFSNSGNIDSKNSNPPLDIENTANDSRELSSESNSESTRRNSASALQLNQSPDPKSRADVAPSTDGLDKATNNISSSESPTESEPQKLSQRVVDIMTEVQTRQKDDQWEEALNEMNALFTKFDSLSPFEQATLLNFYTNTLIQLEMWQETISAFSLLITIPELPQGVHARALQALGQLSSQVEDYVMAKRYYEEWLEFTEGDESLATRRAAVQDLLDELNER